MKYDFLKSRSRKGGFFGGAEKKQLYFSTIDGAVQNNVPNIYVNKMYLNLTYVCSHTTALERICSMSPPSP